MTWICAHDGTPVTGSRIDPWCPTCQRRTVAVENTPLMYVQYRELCDLFTSIGEINRSRRLRWISQAIGRQVRDYRDLTAAEGTTALTHLKERVRAK